MKKVVVTSDKFKGSLSSVEVAETIKSALHTIYPDCEILSFPVADGGEGTLQALKAVVGDTDTVKVLVNDPLNRPILAEYIILNRKTVLIELAVASGLTLISPKEYNPWITTTCGTGQLISHAFNSGYTEFIIGIGGSATNDAGTGLLSALGFDFRDKKGDLVQPGGMNLSRIEKIEFPANYDQLKKIRFRVACDVRNPFYGSQGAAYTFGAQKGADKEMIINLDKGLKHFAGVIQKNLQIDLQDIPGSGAAGGVGGALYSFFDARLLSGIDLILYYLDFNSVIQDADLLITGEGKIDDQTVHGKVIKGIADRGKEYNIPVIALAGQISDSFIPGQLGLENAYTINPPGQSLMESMNAENTKKNLFETVVKIFS
ncbi:MAG: glycerate kinase [Bacteroidales bacterium]|nr:glycerate kinase [Bacteroidales bacterium]